MPDSGTKPNLTKGQRRAARILDVAEELFALRGYEGTTLREIAGGAGIREPGIYNHFSSKRSLYESVLHRALAPMSRALAAHRDTASGRSADLPSLMTDLLLNHPRMAALFHQALQGDAGSVGTRLVQGWLDQLFSQGMQHMQDMSSVNADRATLAIQVIAMFNLTTGYFLSQRALDSLGAGDTNSPDNLARQKRLLRKVIRAMVQE